jgi:hypothetical protein
MSEAALIICWIVSVVVALLAGYITGSCVVGRVLANAIFYRRQRTNIEGAKVLDQLVEDIGRKGAK